jgi:hypothetical protein
LGATESYIVDAIFPTRRDAKNAVCIIAAMQGCKDFIQSVAEPTRELSEHGRDAFTVILPELMKACAGTPRSIAIDVNPVTGGKS